MENKHTDAFVESIDVKLIGDKIKMARKELELSQSELGDRVDLSRVSISQIENGKRQRVNPDIIRRIAETLNKPQAYFYGLTENRPKLKPARHSQKDSPLLDEVIQKLFSLPLPQRVRAAHLIDDLLSWRES